MRSLTCTLRDLSKSKQFETLLILLRQKYFAQEEQLSNLRNNLDIKEIAFISKKIKIIITHDKICFSITVIHQNKLSNSQF